MKPFFALPLLRNSTETLATQATIYSWRLIERVTCQQLIGYLKHTWKIIVFFHDALNVPHGGTLFSIYKKIPLISTSVEWMKGICHTWSRGLPGEWNLAHKGDDRTEIPGNIVRYDALAPHPEVLLWYFVCECAVSKSWSTYHVRGKKMFT